MSAYNVYTIAGLGRIGFNMAQELLAMNLPDTTKAESDSVITLRNGGADVRVVSYDAPESIRVALEGADVLISAIGYRGLPAQDLLLEAAKATGIKLFVPSEYGARSDAMQDKVFAIKEVFRQKLIASGLNYAVFYTGFWADFDLRPFILRDWFDIDFDNGSVHKWFDWETPLSFTTQNDVARYVTHVLVYLPRNEIENRIFRVEGDRQTLNALFTTFLATTGRPKLADMDVKTHTRAELDERLEKDPMLIGMRLFRAAADGMFTVAPEGKETLDNGLWPEWHPEKPLDVMIRSFAVSQQT